MKWKKLGKISCALLVLGLGGILVAIAAGFAIQYFTTIPEECDMTENSVRYGPIRVGTEVILGRHTEVNATGRWVVVMNQVSGSDTKQIYSVSSNFPKEFINSSMEAGYSFYLIDYANGQWIVVMNKTDGYTEEQQWTTSSEFPEDFIDTTWDEKYYIIDLEYGNETWAVVMSKTPKYEGQSYARRSTFTNAEEFIIEKEEDGYFLTDLEYGQNIWVALASKGGSIQGQVYTSSTGSFPDDFIAMNQKAGYSLFDLERRSNTWIVLMRRDNRFSDQVWFTDSDFPEERIEDYLDDNYFIANVSYGGIGYDNWTYEKNNYVGLTATVTRLLGVDEQGCPVVRVNVDRETWMWRVRDMKVASDTSPTFKPSPYEENTRSAQPNRDTPLSLEDGAKITVLADSINRVAKVRIERNPEKVASLPPLGEDVVQLSDFYNFEISQDLMGPVEIRIPFDEDLIPNEPGVLTIGVPTEDGWVFTPVSSYDGYVTFRTVALGDPLIAWHFVKMDRIDLEYKAGRYCEYNIPLTVSPVTIGWDSTAVIRGKVNPSKEFDGKIDEIGLVIQAYSYSIPSYVGTYYTETDDDGHFEVKINPLSNEFFDLQTGTNLIEVHAECDSPGGKFSSTSYGYGYIKIKGDKPSPATPTPEAPANNTAANPTLYLDKNMFCRTGPGKAFPDVTAFYQGQSFPIIGRASNGWYLVAINISTTSKKSCWIGGGVVSGDLSSVQYYEIQEPVESAESSGNVPIRDGNSSWNNQSCYNNYDPNNCHATYTMNVAGYISCSDLKSYGWSDPFSVNGARAWYVHARIFGLNYPAFYQSEAAKACPGLFK